MRPPRPRARGANNGQMSADPHLPHRPPTDARDVPNGLGDPAVGGGSGAHGRSATDGVHHGIADDWRTPFECGNGNQTTTWDACIAFHERLAAAFPQWLRLEVVGHTDGGAPLHLGVFSADGCADPAAVKAAGRAVCLNNNGIHPGEPEGMDACMALVRDLCLSPAHRAALGDVVLVYIPAYNVDGMRQRGNTSRVNQNGPEAFGFRGNARHLDLNRDFAKLDSLAARTFARAFTRWDPDVMVDTHTSNGADYPYVMTLIATQPDKLGGACGALLRDHMLPALYDAMAARGEPMCPYVNPVAETPDDGIADFLDTPRFSTGYAALHHCIGFMPETHMLKPFADRVRATRALLDCVLDHVRTHGAAVRAARAADRTAIAHGAPVALDWVLDAARSRPFRFRGYTAVRTPSRLGRYQRLRYDRSAPWERDIAWFDRYTVCAQTSPPWGYLVPQAWHDVVDRLQAHGVPLRRVQAGGRVDVEGVRFTRFTKRAQPFEGRHLHDAPEVALERCTAEVAAGDWVAPLGGARDRLAIELLEPLGVDSFFRWGFFDSVLERKEHFSDYVFEDLAERWLAEDAVLAQKFADWQAQHPELLGDAQAVLGFLFEHAPACAEPAHARYPVWRLTAEPVLPLG